MSSTAWVVPSPQLFVEPETVQGRSLLRRYAVDDVTALPLEMIEPALNRLAALYADGGDDQALVAISQASSTRWPVQSARNLPRIRASRRPSISSRSA